MLFKIYCFFARLFRVKLELEKAPIREIDVLLTKHTHNNKKEIFPSIKMAEINDTLTIYQGEKFKKKFLEVNFKENSLLLDIYCDSYYKKLKKKK
jgi:hypothetical protein